MLRTLFLLVAIFSAVTAIFPWLARSLSGVREVIEILLVPAPPTSRGRAAGDLRLGAGQAQEVRLVVRGHHPRAGDGGVGDSAGVDADTRVEESATLATSVVLFVVLLLARREFFAVVPRRNVFVALATLIIGFAITIPWAGRWSKRYPVRWLAARRWGTRPTR